MISSTGSAVLCNVEFKAVEQYVHLPTFSVFSNQNSFTNDLNFTSLVVSIYVYFGADKSFYQGIQKYSHVIQENSANL
jgi:hypothetical protein